MASLKPIEVGNSKRLENLYSGYKGKVSGKTKPNSRESSPGQFNDNSLNYSSAVLNVDPSKRYK